MKKNEWYLRFIPKIWRSKTLLVMKQFIVIMLIFNLNAFSSILGQEIKEFKVNNVNLKECIRKIEEKTGVGFLYKGYELKNVTGISVEVKNTKVDDLLNLVLKNTGYTHEMDHGIILIIKNSKLNSVKPKKTLIKGKVTDENGNPLPGVSVIIKGTTVGTATDNQGNYKIELLDATSKTALVYSFIGMQTKVVTIKDKKVIDVKLLEDKQQLDEVVVNTGYHTIEKRRLTSAVTSLKGEKLLVPGVTSVDKLLEARVPGMIFMQNSGQVGAAAKIRIRGTSTLLGNQEPLWVVDGIIQQNPVDIDPAQINDLDFVNLLGNAISGINPEDIEQIDILKDASATAIYGARAANGVIVVTTKKGKVGPPSISYSTGMTFTQRPRYTDRSMNLMNSRDRINLSRELIEKKMQYSSKINPDVGYEGALVRLYSGEINYDQFKREVDHYETVNTDWFDLFCKDSFSHNHTVSVSGGAKTVKYYASVGFGDQQGVLQGEKNKNYNTNINITGLINKFSYRFGITASKSDKSYSPKELQILDYAYKTTRTLPVYNEDGSYWYYRRKSTGFNEDYYRYNLMNEIDNSYDEIDNDRVGVTFSLDYNFSDAFKASTTVSYTKSNTQRELYFGEKTFYISNIRKSEFGVTPPDDSMCPFGGELKKESTIQSSYTVRTQFGYNKYLGVDKDHFIGISAGGELSSNEYKSTNQLYRAYVPERGKMIVGIDMNKYKKLADWRVSNRDALGVFKHNLMNTVSTYFTASYSYKNIYTANINGRLDFSNKFGTRSNDKILPIWSISGRWNIKEDILKGADWVNELALRGSFGLQGNMLDGQTPELIIKKGERNLRFDSYESTIKNFPNPNLKWETTKSYNGTLNFSLFNNKLSGTLSYFYKKTSDAFLNKKISRINGQEYYVVNTGTIENKGFEVGLNFNPVKRTQAGDFYWTIDPQFGQIVNTLLSKVTNNIQEKPTERQISYADYLSGRVFIKGQPLNTFYSYKFKGLDPKNGAPMFYNAESYRKNQYLSMSPDDVYAQVMEKSGTRVPFLQGGIMNSLGYKDFALTFNIAYSLGNKVRLLKLYSQASFENGTMAPSPMENVRNEFNSRWRRPGDEKYTNIPAILGPADFNATRHPWWKDAEMGNRTFAGNIWEMYDNSNLRVVDGDYIKLQSISFRYMLPKTICKKFNINSAHIGLSGTDLFTVCNKALKGQSPMQSGSSDGINLSVRPTYSLSLNVNF